MVLECSVVDDHADLAERGHLVADDLIRIGCGGPDRLAQALQRGPKPRRHAREVVIDRLRPGPFRKDIGTPLSPRALSLTNGFGSCSEAPVLGVRRLLETRGQTKD